MFYIATILVLLPRLLSYGRQVLQNLGLWSQTLSRDLPNLGMSTDNGEIIYEPFDDGWTQTGDTVTV
jgi:hypothetical protein